MVSSGGDDGEDVPAGGATSLAGNEGESHHSRDEPCQGNHSLDDLVEYIGPSGRK